MRWIQASLTLLVLLIGLALGKAEAAEERPARGDKACGFIQAGTDSQRDFTPSVDLSPSVDSLIQEPSFLADPSHNSLWRSLDRLIPALPFLVETPLDAIPCQHQCSTGWPATVVRRLIWLQRFLF